MPEERRDRQQLGFNHVISSVPCDRRTKQLRHQSGQLDFAPSRWLKISCAAEKQTNVFNNLLTHIKVDTLKEAYLAIDGSKAVGLDGINKKLYGKQLDENLQDLEDRIHNGSYKPMMKKQVNIPKGNGKTRPIAISCFEDKLVEWVIAKILTCIYDQTFIQDSYGFCANHSPDGAIRRAYKMLENNKRPHVVEIDFASFFNTIPHKNLIRILSKRISDRRFKGLIGRFLISGVMDEYGATHAPDAGTPQGSIMSPILANIYLHYMLDQWFEDEYNPPTNGMIRYADDAIFFFQNESDAQQFEQALKGRIQKFGLQLNAEKTRIVQFERNSGNDFDFLGFTFYWGYKPVKAYRKLKVKTRKQTLLKKIQDFTNWIKKARNQWKEKELWGLAKAKLIGHYNYYGYASNRSALSRFYWEALASLFKWLNRRSQKKSFNWETFRNKAMCILPKPYPMAKLKHLKWSPLCYAH